MSKTSKKKNKQKNLMAKRARRQANKARYQKMRESGQNTKSVRARGVNKLNRKANRVDHPDGHCGNVACKKCFPTFSTPARRGDIANIKTAA